MTNSSADPAGTVVRGTERLIGTVLHPGEARGTVLRLDRPLSFWGGTSLTGVIIDRQHPQRGACIAGRILAMRSGRGSSSSSSVLAEQVRAGRGPAAVVMTEPDAIIALGAIVAAELYRVRVPVVVLTAEDFAGLTSGEDVSVTAPARDAPA